MHYTFAGFSFGCRVNAAETAAIERRLIEAGYTHSFTSPDLYIINSCAVTSKAEREVRQMIYRIKKNSPGAKIILTGCAATYWEKSGICAKLPIDLLVENFQKDRIVDQIKLHYPLTSVNYKINNFYKNKYENSGRLLVKIQDGCRCFCSYCIVPYLRKIVSSESIKNIKLTVTNRKDNIKEVILTAVNTKEFGKDTRETLIKLIQTILTKTNIDRISFGSIHPTSLDPDFLLYYKTLAKDPRFIDFFHVPVQSGSNAVLDLMRRGYRREEISDRLLQIRKINPKAFIATDVIVGFLGETEREFGETYDFLQSSPIDKFHVFRFTRRVNTAADFMAKRIKEPSSSEKIRRSQALIALSQKKYLTFLKKLVGWQSSALMIGDLKEGIQEALLENQIPVQVWTNQNLSGQIKRVKIEEIGSSGLIGRII